MAVVPEALMARFQAVAIQRLERVDAGWTALTHEQGTPELEQEVLRDLHTLKGDARVVGLSDVSLLCQRLEDLLEAARGKKYRVHDDVDIVVTMAIQFIGMLVRKQSSARRGIDIDGFMKQIEGVMSEWLRRSSEAPHERVSVGPHLRVKDHRKLSGSSGLRLSTSTTSVFLEYLRSEQGEPKKRVYDLWKQLLIGVLEANGSELAPMVAGHLSAARELAGKLEKRVRIDVAGDNLEVTPETLETISVFLVHALNNALDHGIEPAPVRKQKGKSQVAEIDVRIRRDGDFVIVSISDDGAGIDIDRVRRRAIERNLLSEAVAPDATREQILEYLFAPGFSTKDKSSDVSGRGIGLDAAHVEVDRHGGTLSISSITDAGTTITAKVVDARGSTDVTCFEGTSGIRFAVPSKYGVRKTDLPASTTPEELIKLPKGGPSAVHLEIFDDVSKYVLAAGSRPVLARGIRKCPTADTELVEIVFVDGKEVVLLRPKAFT
jgi:two-component system chemotaxis sensor kinase CheA